jgi:hypothetical protein
MKKDVPLPAIIGAGVVVLAVLGYFVYRTSAPAPLSTPDPKVMRERMMQRDRGVAGPAPQGQSQMMRDRQMRGMASPPPR